MIKIYRYRAAEVLSQNKSMLCHLSLLLTACTARCKNWISVSGLAETERCTSTKCHFWHDALQKHEKIDN